MALSDLLRHPKFRFLILINACRARIFFIFAIYTNTMLHFPLCLAHCDSGRCWKAEGLSLLLEYKYFDKVFHIVLPDLIWISHVLHRYEPRKICFFVTSENDYNLIMQISLILWSRKLIKCWSDIWKYDTIVVNLLSKIWSTSDQLLMSKGSSKYSFRC